MRKRSPTETLSRGPPHHIHIAGTVTGKKRETERKTMYPPVSLWHPLPLPLPLLLSWWLFAGFGSAQASCYYPGGKLVGADTPCDPDASHSMCCAPGDICLSNKLCFVPNINHYHRGVRFFCFFFQIVERMGKGGRGSSCVDDELGTDGAGRVVRILRGARGTVQISAPASRTVGSAPPLNQVMFFFSPFVVLFWGEKIFPLTRLW